MLFPLLLEIRWFWRLGRTVVRGLVWLVATTWEGVRTIWRLVLGAGRVPDLFRETLRCPRGHATPVYGVYQCKCGALHEGWAFDRCIVCGHSAGWTPCLDCGLPVKNPLP